MNTNDNFLYTNEALTIGIILAPRFKWGVLACRWHSSTGFWDKSKKKKNEALTKIFCQNYLHIYTFIRQYRQNNITISV